MLNVTFQGWWQNRLATDPDPNDEPRGVSGKTAWLPGEPYLDGIIRLQDPVAPRYPHEHDIGVNVYRVAVDDPAAPGGQRVLADHPLVGARVNLLDNPRFEERGFVVAYQIMPIVPFKLEIAGQGIRIVREDLFDITRPQLPFEEVASRYPELITRRALDVAPQDAEVAEATGILDYVEYRRQRRRDLEHLATTTTDPIQRAALAKRIGDLRKDDEGFVGATLAAQQFLGLKGTYSFAMNGPLQVADPERRLGGGIGTSMPWPLTFWMGGYDVDALCGYMRGILSVPFFATNHHA